MVQVDTTAPGDHEPFVGCDVVIVAAPRTAFTPAESERLRTYLLGGGSALVAISPLEDPAAGSRTGMVAANLDSALTALRNRARRCAGGGEGSAAHLAGIAGRHVRGAAAAARRHGVAAAGGDARRAAHRARLRAPAAARDGVAGGGERSPGDRGSGVRGLVDRRRSGVDRSAAAAGRAPRRPGRRDGGGTRQGVAFRGARSAAGRGGDGVGLRAGELAGSGAAPRGGFSSSRARSRGSPRARRSSMCPRGPG